MENDNTGNFQSPSLNYLLNTAYSAGAYTHTNSWGSARDSDQGKYTSESEDVDDEPTANFTAKATVKVAAKADGDGQCPGQGGRRGDSVA